MLDEFVTILSIVGTLLGLVGILAFVYAYFSMNLSKARIEALQGDRDDQAARIRRLEENEVRLTTERDAFQTRVTVLEGLVTHDAKIQELIRVVGRHDANVEAKHGQTMEGLTTLIGLVTRLVETMESNHAG